MKTPDRRRSGTLPSAESGLRGLYFGLWCYRRPTISASPTAFHTVSEGNFSEVRLTAYYCGTTATASISTKKSGCARAETNIPVIAGGLGVWGQAFWNAAKPACSDCPSTT